ncbi:hypothetical protein B0T20DRAFT_42137 [Sordaria brevicollis]|uniref:Uncharacterized protein n=1 Tax=Sordaria brevicollis TaxID=83679 RepID=A0AAE0P9C6_SORBR|nr:hypothetical protein B0T20DRAFT_42137 [Sordaria brevicollis]
MKKAGPPAPPFFSYLQSVRPHQPPFRRSPPSRVPSTSTLTTAEPENPQSTFVCITGRVGSAVGYRSCGRAGAGTSVAGQVLQLSEVKLVTRHRSSRFDVPFEVDHIISTVSSKISQRLPQSVIVDDQSVVVNCWFVFRFLGYYCPCRYDRQSLLLFISGYDHCHQKPSSCFYHFSYLFPRPFPLFSNIRFPHRDRSIHIIHTYRRI